MRRIFTGMVVAILASVLLVCVPGVARAQGADVTTTVTRDQTATISFTNPCTGATGTAELTFTTIFVLNARPTGTFSVAVETIGSFTLVPDNPAEPTITGHFVSTDTFAGGANDVETAVLTATGTASDGSTYRLQFITHLNETGTGVTMSFDRCV